MHDEQLESEHEASESELLESLELELEEKGSSPLWISSNCAACFRRMSSVKCSSDCEASPSTNMPPSSVWSSTCSKSLSWLMYASPGIHDASTSKKMLGKCMDEWING